ncbi:MAG: menaquinone biosynthesis family protein [Bacteroidota bacterium]|jgi:1,4-dihydroxy-6-naphthoate synthase|nr:1,4-dihydroxy-6-naphthoate synthase [Bacteroidota bacterium]MCA6444471.1 1,4-dihydroxy-6-naphthoate synthase [Bacteroidota bacterium]
MDIKIGYSPCPNDCFIFDALVHQKINTNGLIFKPVLEDVETLNQWALSGELPVTKLSYHAFLNISNNYALLRSGSALGFNCGPILISKNGNQPIHSVAIPGKNTTANLLLSLAYPDLTKKKEMLFSSIENAVLNGEVDAGLIIHESRFTYAEKGLQKIMDLGEFWDGLIQAPIPLGGIAASKKLDLNLRKEISRLIKESVQFAFENPNESLAYVKANAQEMDDKVIQQHIQLYVNEFSVDLGEVGINAIKLLSDKGFEVGIIKYKNEIEIN